MPEQYKGSKKSEPVPEQKKGTLGDRIRSQQNQISAEALVTHLTQDGTAVRIDRAEYQYEAPSRKDANRLPKPGHPQPRAEPVIARGAPERERYSLFADERKGDGLAQPKLRTNASQQAVADTRPLTSGHIPSRDGGFGYPQQQSTHIPENKKPPQQYTPYQPMAAYEPPAHQQKHTPYQPTP